MIILSPRQIGCDVNLDNVQFFIDYCNSAIQKGDFYSTGFLPTFKVISLTMDVEIVNESNNEVISKTITLTSDERSLVQSLFSKQGWFTEFTTREKITEFLPNANVESIAILSRIMTVIPETYIGPIFTLGTFAFGTPETSKVPKLVEENPTEVIASIVTDTEAQPEVQANND